MVSYYAPLVAYFLQLTHRFHRTAIPIIVYLIPLDRKSAAGIRDIIFTLSKFIHICRKGVSLRFLENILTLMISAPTKT